MPRVDSFTSAMLVFVMMLVLLRSARLTRCVAVRTHLADSGALSVYTRIALSEGMLHVPFGHRSRVPQRSFVESSLDPATPHSALIDRSEEEWRHRNGGERREGNG